MRKKRLFILLSFILLIGIAGSVYFQFFRRPKYIKLPVYYASCSTTPLVDVEIEKKIYRLEWDSGLSDHYSLHKDVLDGIKNKEKYGISRLYDIKGNLYNKPEYKIPYISFGGYKFRPLIAAEESEQFLKEGCRIGTPLDESFIQEFFQNIHGRIGMAHFATLCLYFDLPKSLIYIAKDKEALLNEGIFSPKGFVNTSFSSGATAIILADTDRGPKRFLLDTGSSKSILRDLELPELTWHISPYLVIEGVDFGSQEFVVYNFPTEFFKTDIDGILGIDFLKEHPVLLDMKNQTAWIGNAIK